MRRLLVCLALALLFASPAAACINDAELPSHEREFRSQYRNAIAPVVPLADPSPVRQPFMFIGGGVLLTGALTWTLATRRSK